MATLSTHPGRPAMRSAHRWRTIFAAALITSGGAVAVAAPAAHAATMNLTQFVNPFIGTDDSNAPNPVGGGAGGSTYPRATGPFRMVQFSPHTPSPSPPRYRFSDGTVEDFSLTHLHGAGCPNKQELNLLPITAAASP